MSDLTFIKNLPSEFTGYHLLPANTRYPCDWGYNRQTEVKQVYHILQLIGNGEYIFLVTDSEFSYWGHSDKFETANKLGQDWLKVIEEEESEGVAVTNNDIKWGIDIEVFAEVYSQRMANS